MKSVSTALLIVALTTTSALADAGHAHDLRVYGEPGTEGRPSRVVRLEMRETDHGMIFNPRKVLVRKGEQVRFVVTNTGDFEHEMVVGTVEENIMHGMEMAKNPDMEHDDPNSVRLAPKSKGDIVWKFTNVGEFDFSCLLPGHREGGMFGTIIVQ